MHSNEQLPVRKLFRISLGIIAFLIVLIVVLLVRTEKWRHRVAEAEAVPVLVGADEVTLKQLRAFGAILGDHGWRVHWNSLARHRHAGAAAVLRGSFQSEWPDKKGEHTTVGVDALVFEEGAALPQADPFPLDQWRELHPIVHFEELERMVFSAIQSGRTFFVFYQYQDISSTELPDQFKRFLTGDSKQRASFRRELSQANAAREEAFAAVKAIQEALLGANLYEGEIDGLNGWRTKHALQRFLRAQGHYSGDIDGVFGNRTLKALGAFREQAGLEESDQIDAELAQAIVGATAATEDSTVSPDAATVPSQ